MTARMSAVVILLTLLAPLPSLAVDYEALAREVVTKLSKGDFGGVYRGFDVHMKRALNRDRLAMTWGGLTSQMGDYRKIVEVRQTRMDGFHVADVIVDFARNRLAIRLAFDDRGRTRGFYILPLDKAIAPQAAPKTRPSETASETASEAADLISEEVTFGAAPWEIPGTLTLPQGQGPFPAVLFVGGSGPVDRDETIGPNKPFRRLAEGLARRGIASLRFDKRTKVHGAALVEAVPEITVEEEVLADVRAALAFLRTRPEVAKDRLYLLGHSLGGLLAPLIAHEDGHLAGLVMMAAPSRPLTVLMEEQLRYIRSLPGHDSPEEVARIAEVLERLEAYRAGKLSASDTLLGASVAYYRDLEERRPVEVAATLDLPLLILQGGRDYQVTTADFEEWKKALAGRNRVTFRLYPALNHLFAAGRGKSTPEEYSRPQPLAEEVINEVARFVLGA